MHATNTVPALVEGLRSGAVDIVDLTHRLDPQLPYFQLPEDLGFPSQPGFTYETLSDYDERGPAWRWGVLRTGEHVGTHFDAPTHWVTGRDGFDVASVPAERLVGPACVIDKRAECAVDPDFLLSIADVRAFEREHGPLPEGAWLVLRTGWGERTGDPRAYLNDLDGVQHTPGIAPECARWLAHETHILGLGVETLGIDAGQAGALNPPFPAHHYLLGANKYGLPQLANVDRLPPTGALLIAAPLRIPGGSGSPCRVLALVSRDG